MLVHFIQRIFAELTLYNFTIACGRNEAFYLRSLTSDKVQLDLHIFFQGGVSSISTLTHNHGYKVLTKSKRDCANENRFLKIT